jgi:predicted dehydrogenase
VLDDARVSAIAIATPVETHFDIAKAALLAGKHVIIEKPMTQTVTQGEQLCRLAAERGLTLMVDHTFLYTGSVEFLRRLVEQQQFGRVLYVDSVRVNLGLFQNNANVLYDLAPHDVSIFNYILGEYPSAVSAQVAHCIHDDMADVAFLTLRYPSGVLAHAHLSWLSPVKIRRLTIAGRSKMAIWDDVEPSEKVRIYDKGVETNPNDESSAQRMVSYRTGDMHAPALDSTEALSKVAQEFYDAITAHKPVRSSAQDGLAVVRVLEATDRSIADAGTTIYISDGVLA